MNLHPGMDVNWVPGMTLDEMEKQCILKAFQFYRQNKTQTAGALGISIRTLDNKLEKYEADAEAFAEQTAAERQRRAESLDRLRGVEISRRYQVGGSEQINPLAGRATNPQSHEQIANGSSAGAHLQPTDEAAPEHALPVSKRQEVQSVLPPDSSAHRKHKRR